MTWEAHLISVYLDSQDYSNLSEEVLSNDLQDVKNKLLGYAAAGQVRFYFSSLIVSEAAPLESSAVKHSIRRGDFLSAICGRNVLRFNQEIIEAEIKSLLGNDNSKIDPTCLEGDWFPIMDFPELPSIDELARDAIDEDASARGLNREQRRAAKRKVSKKGRLRPEVKHVLKTANSEAYAAELMSKYPMLPESADVFRRYCAGAASKKEATAAFKASLRDPCNLMKWFATDPEMAKPLADMVRRPGEDMGDRIRQLVLLSEEIKEIEDFVDDSPLKRNKWNKMVDRVLVNVATDVAKKTSPGWSGQLKPKEIVNFCPGFSAMVLSIFSSVWDNVGGSKKEMPSDSQFPDAMHAVYTPYVDFFRADTYMAPHIRKHAGLGGGQVVEKLAQLPAAIEKRLASFSPA